MHVDQLLITVIILVISGVSTLIQRKRQHSRDSTPLPPRPRGELRPLKPTEPHPFNWEEQLRRLLEPEAPPAAPPTPPPVPVPVPAAIPRSAADLPRAIQSLDLDQAATEQKLTRRLTGLDEAVAAYTGAMRIPEIASARLYRTEHHVSKAPRKSPRVLSSAVAISREQLRQARGARQAIIAATILGPPKGLSETEI